MSGNKLLFDSNILIYLSKKELNLHSFTSVEDLPYISIITYMEVMGHNFQKSTEKKFIENFCANSLIIELDRNIVNKVIELRKSHKIKLPDAIISATSMELDATLVTRNTVDFNSIKGLKILNPF